MKFCSILVFLFFLALTSNAQFFDQNFLSKVKQIDEFIDRFNYDEENARGYALLSKRASTHQDMAEIYEYIYGDKHTDRVDVLLSLFSYENALSIGKKNIREFVLQTTDSTNQRKLGFYDDDWYAVVTGEVTYKGHKESVQLTLKNKMGKTRDGQDGSYWALVSARADFLFKPADIDKRLGVNAGSHGVNFVPLISALEDQDNAYNLTAEEYEPDTLSIFLYAVQNGELSFNSVKAVNYHFLQIDGWIFSVEYFNRSDSNSGWLISDLIKVEEDDQKQLYRSEILSLR